MRTTEYMKGFDKAIWHISDWAENKKETYLTLRQKELLNELIVLLQWMKE